MTQDNNQETVKKDQELVVGNSVTKNILAKYEVDVVTQEELDEREQNSANENSAVNENQQVTSNDEVVDITDDDLKILADAGVTEEQLSGKTLAEIKQIVVDNKPEQVAKSTQDQSVVISDALADSLSAKYPFAKNLRGKTLEEVMDIIQNQNSYITTLEQRKSNDASANETKSNSQQISQTNDQLTQQEVIDILNLDPAEATKRINQMIMDGSKKVAESVVDQKLKEYLPAFNKLQELQVENEKKNFFSVLGGQLPKGSDPQVVFEQWKKDTMNQFTKEEKMALVSNPALMIKIIAKDYNLKKTSTEKNQLESNQNQTIKKQTYENLVKLIKQSKNTGNNAVFNFPRKNTGDTNLSEEGTSANPVIDKILEKYEDQ